MGGMMGIFVKTVLPSGQAAEDDGKLQEGDEILAVNGSVLHGLSHSEAIFIFKKIRVGPVVIQVSRRPGRGGGSWMAMTSSSAASDNQADQPKNESADNQSEVNKNAERDKAMKGKSVSCDDLIEESSAQ